MGKRSGRPDIQADVRLGSTLRILAGGSYLYMIMSYEIYKFTVYEGFHSTCDALIEVLSLPGIPIGTFRLRMLSNKFKISRDIPLSGCVGALDGVSINIKKPEESERSAAYYCRKDYYYVPYSSLLTLTAGFYTFRESV